ncbi:MAG: site-specific DNA-methyltransferase [Opitutae bacterium]|nr:site-specific DNA-methyltransferase [Opitutae bacterium]
MPSLHFKGKSFVQNHHLVVPFHELTPVKAKGTSKTASLHDNLIVEGDNLKALKALLPTYHSKVKCIYIDPPYNTGNEGWAYNDAVNSPMMQDWLGKTVDREDLTRHDKWCCMMLPRLKLLREFLTDDGAIFVSIDDNEIHRLRCLMDEVFGEENFVATIIWQKKYSTKADSKFLSESHEFICVFARDIEKLALNGLARTEKQKEGYKNPDADARGDWTSGDLLRMEARDYAIFEIAGPTGKKFLPPKGTSWRFNKDKIEELRADKRIWFGEDGTSRPRLKRFLSEVREMIPAQTLWSFGEVGHSDSAKKELAALFADADEVFATPKPVALLQRIVALATEEDSVVLDAFAGSATTAHAVLAQNQMDGGGRRFVLIESAEYADTLSAERVRRVARGVTASKDEAVKAGLGGTFSYFKLGRPMQMSAILDGSTLPDFESLARYVFFTATGMEFDAKKLNRKTGFIGTSRHHDVFLLYTEDADKLKQLALTLDGARALPSISGKPKLVFAPTKYLDESFLDRLRITFCQLPFQIYKALDA